MKKALVIVDMQNDFITGSLENKAAELLLTDMVNYIKAWDGDLIFTRDTHQSDYMETQEERIFPCLTV